MSTLLSFDKAPPFSVPARFFFSAPWFGVLAGLLVLWEGDAIVVSRWAPPVLALTHLLTVGFILQVMVGALFQVLPVVAGANIERPLFWARVLHPALNAGALALAAGMWGSQPFLLVAGAGLVVSVVVVFVVLAARALWLVSPSSPAIPAIRFALGGLLLTVVIGGYLLSAYLHGGEGQALLTALHVAWGLIGGAGVLLIGIAYIVVPMFQLTPPYHGVVSRWLVRILIALLLSWTLVLLFGVEWATSVVGFALVFVLVCFALMTLYLQRQSKRPRADASFRLWQFSMLMALLALGAWAVQLWWPGLSLGFLIGVWALPGALVSVMAAMLYKIVPFLSWLHMQNHGARVGVRRLPHMGSYMSERAAWWHMGLHVSAVLLLILTGAGFPVFARAAGVMMILAFATLGVNLLVIARRYRVARDGLSAGRLA